MNVSASTTGRGVALKAPAIVRRHLFCMTASLSVEVFRFLLVAPFGMCHAAELCVIPPKNIILKNRTGSFRHTVLLPATSG